MRTVDAHKAGTTEIELTVYHLAWLDDELRPGNLGREGVDEFFETYTFADEVAAKYGAPVRIDEIRRKHPKHEVEWARLTSVRWDRDEFDDTTYGHVVDALRTETGTKYGYLADDGNISWDEEWS